MLSISETSAQVPALQKAELLAIFAEGFLLAKAKLAGMTAPPPKNRPGDDAGKGDQRGLFDQDR